MQEYIDGHGTVELLAGGGKIYTDVAARFCRSERPLTELFDLPRSPEIIRNVLSSGHMSALEFDWFIFGVEGFSRVVEAQLIRKRCASYMIKSGREELYGKRHFSVAYPNRVRFFEAYVDLPDGHRALLNGQDLAAMVEQWYNAGVAASIPEEELRYLKPQATTFRGLIGMNAHALHDFFAARLCRRAQFEIRSMAHKMLKLCRDAAPELFATAGAHCEVLGYCPENERQHKLCQKQNVPTKQAAMVMLKEMRKNDSFAPA